MHVGNVIRGRGTPRSPDTRACQSPFASHLPDTRPNATRFPARCLDAVPSTVEFSSDQRIDTYAAPSDPHAGPDLSPIRSLSTQFTGLLIPEHGLLTKIRFVSHMAGDGGMVSEYRILSHRFP